MILAGDVGGTKTALALFERGGGRLELHDAMDFPSAAFGSLEEVLERFVGGRSGLRLEGACFGVAGPVIAGAVAATNLPWDSIEAERVAGALGAPVRILNDLEATAYGMLELPEEAFVDLNPEAVRRRGNAAVIAAGTGLGEAALLWDGERHRALPGEAGHADWAPRSEEEVELLGWLGARHGGRVSWERVLSGPGLADLYRFSRERGGLPEPAWLAERMAAEDPGAVVTEVALARRDLACEHALALFVSAYGAEAGNLALRSLAVAGLYVGGGIAPKILPALREGAFLGSFLAKGRFRALLRHVPLRLSTNPRTALLGAASQA